MNKLTRWIDRQNERVCLKITQIYNQKIDLGYSHFFAVNPIFYPYYLLRLVFIVFNCFRLNKKLAQPYRLAMETEGYQAIFLTLLGLRFFVRPNYEPRYYEKLPLSKVIFNDKSSPIVSVIISSTDNHALEICIKSLFMNISDRFDYEVIISSATPQVQIAGVSGLIYKPADECISAAKGIYICFLNAQAIVLPMWLESLIETIEEDSAIGCVGSKQLTSLGLISRAGGVIDETGRYHAYGDYQHPSAFNYDYKRPVDFCYPPGMIIRKVDLDTVRSLNNNIYQAIEICLTLRHHLGKKIVYQPAAALIDLQGPIPISPNENTDAFILKWDSILSSVYKFESLEDSATRFLPKKTISVIDSYLPFFDKESGSNRLFQLLKIFQHLNYQVNFIPNDGKYVAPYYRILTAKLGIPVVYNYCGKSHFRQAIFSMINRTEILWISRPNLNLKYQYLMKHFSGIKWIYDTVDLHYVRLFRQAKSEMKPELIKKGLRIKKLELALASAANATIAITDVEKEVLALEGVKNLHVIPNVHDIKEIKHPISFADRKGIVFIGGYKHKPNIDAVIWLINEIMPIVRKKIGDVPVYLLGSYPTPEICSLTSGTVVVPGYLADVNPYFMNSRIFVAPLRYGAGMKGKIGQSLEYGLPIVSTTIGVEGMNLVHDQEVLIADDTQAFADQIIRLYEDPQIWEKIKCNSLNAIRNYSPEMVGEKLQSLLATMQQKTN